METKDQIEWLSGRIGALERAIGQIQDKLGITFKVTTEAEITEHDIVIGEEIEQNLDN